MPLNPSGPMSIGGPTVGQSINLELNLSATANSNLNQANFRTLAAVPAGAISISNFYGKSNLVSRGLFNTVTFTAPITFSNQQQVIYQNIETTGSFGSFGNITAPQNWASGGIGNNTRAVLAGGRANNAPATATYTLAMIYTTFGTSGTWTAFGNLTGTARASIASGGNSTRGVSMGGNSGTAPPGGYNSIDYITIATTGNAAAFGVLGTTKNGGGTANSPTRTVLMAGTSPAPTNPTQGVAFMQYITLATTGNATPFGNLGTGVASVCGGVSSSTRGILAGGGTIPANAIQSLMQYITIATAGNSTTFGNLVAAKVQGVSTASNTRGIWSGGKSGPAGANPALNTTDYVTIATTGNGVSWGTLSSTVYNAQDNNGSSNNAGGQQP